MFCTDLSSLAQKKSQLHKRIYTHSDLNCPFKYCLVLHVSDDGKPVWVPAEPWLAGSEISIMLVLPCGFLPVIDNPLWPKSREPLLYLLGHVVTYGPTYSTYPFNDLLFENVFYVILVGIVQ